ncbi:protein MARD1-like [Asparagus officinalis]|uniref:protein MARD1-like n=1 Tax=Asparagus officinalis TaxID=4686 RepID=UPI00098E0A6A|nr:protein MARD1-like [Asparagus officinalis]
MLKKNSRPVSNKQNLMADHLSLPCPTANYNKPPTSPLFPLSPRLYGGFSPRGNLDIDAAMSPTSILETKPFTLTRNRFSSDKNHRKSVAESTHEPVGLGIVDSLKKPSKPENRMVLKIQIPSYSCEESLQSPTIEFGVKNKEAQLSLLSPVRRNPMETETLVSGCILSREMEMSEDYTCVIAHGPNPKMTHIFDNYIVENCGKGFASMSPRKKESRVSDGFLSFCHACKKKLGQGKDIFMYRGEKAFCSHECRYQEMLFDEGIEDCLPMDNSVTL